MNLLLVEDHILLRETLQDQLAEAGFNVSAYESAEDVVEQSLTRWDLAVLDVNLPGEKGTVLAQRLRQSQPKIGIVVLTVINELSEKVNAYELGADIYLTKPVDQAELTCVLRALSKRIALQPTAPNPDALQLYWEGRLLSQAAGSSVRLTAHETQLIQAFLLANDKQLETWQVMSVLEKDDRDKSAIEVLVSRLRKKLTSLSGHEQPLIALRNKGYQLMLDIEVL
ncbi:MAG: response regulator transcription factor [Thiomicrospira sp.]